MSLRTLPAAAGILALGFSSWVAALGLGEINLNTHLNEPLDARISVHSAEGLGEQEILVGLASPEDFRRVGVERDFHIAGLRFEIEMDGRNRPVIRVTSENPIREPYLNFLVEVQWPNGRLLREYTLLLDPPVFSEGRADARAPTTDQPQPSDRTTRRQEPAPRTDTLDIRPGTEEYPVRSGDTLWRIAANMDADQGDIQQRMAALQQLNPDAFIDGDANKLRAGYVLRLPDGASIAQAPASPAQRRDSDEPQAAPVSASTRTAETPRESPSQGRLQLSARESEEGGRGAGGTGDGGGVGGGMRNEVANLRDEMEKSQRENRELRERLARLEEQLQTVQRLVELSDDELRAVQLAVDSGEDPTGSAPQAQADAMAQEQGEAAATAAPADNDDGIDQAAAAGPAETGAGETPAPTPPAPAEDTGSGWLNIPVIAALVALLALLAGYAAWRRKRSGAEDEQLFSDMLEDIDSREEPRRGTAAATAAATTLEPEQPEAIDDIELDEADNLFEVGDDRAHRPELDLNDEERVESINEADIYLSLGNFDEARVILEKALESEPDRADLNLKMLELLVAEQDVAGFDNFYPRIEALGDPAAEERAQELRAELYADPSVASTPEADYQIATIVEEPAPADSEDTPVSEAEEAFDLDLDEDQIDQATEQAAEREQRAESAGPDSDNAAADGEELDLSAELEEIDRQLSQGVEEGAPKAPREESAGTDYASIDLESEFNLDDDADKTGDKALDDSDDWLKESLGEDAGGEEPVVETDLGDDDFEFLDNADEAATQLELAEAYIDMGDPAGAREILSEVVESGSDKQKEKARTLLDGIN